MASLVKEQMTEVLGSEMKSVIRPLPKFSPDYKPGAASLHTEIILYEDHMKKALEHHQLSHTHHPGSVLKDQIYQSGESKFF